jgi:hypothetical protein
MLLLFDNMSVVFLYFDLQKDSVVNFQYLSTFTMLCLYCGLICIAFSTAYCYFKKFQFKYKKLADSSSTYEVLIWLCQSSPPTIFLRVSLIYILLVRNNYCTRMYVPLNDAKVCVTSKYA